MAETHEVATDAGPPLMSRRSSAVLQKGMVASGMIFALYLVGHLLGNLQVYLGPEPFNAYAMRLRTLGAPLLPAEGLLYSARVILLIALVMHLVASQVVGRRIRSHFAAGRIPPPPEPGPLRKFAMSTAKLTGWLLLAFVVFHLLDLTLGTLVSSDSFREIHDGRSFAYENLVASLERPWAAAAYLFVMLGMFFHVLNGLITTIVFDSGIRFSSLWQRIVIIGAQVLALLLFLGNASIPIAVLTGMVS